MCLGYRIPYSRPSVHVFKQWKKGRLRSRLGAALCFAVPNSSHAPPKTRSYSERIAAGGGATAPALPLRSVGNSQALADTALVEALNLKAAVEMALGNMEGARAALGDMPPR